MGICLMLKKNLVLFSVFTAVLILSPNIAIGFPQEGKVSLFSTMEEPEGVNSVILVTGFESFGKHGFNPSGDIAKKLDGMVIENHTITGIVLPVNYSESVEIIIQKIEQLKPEIVISLGLAATYDSIHVEKIAVNLKKIPKKEGKGFSLKIIDGKGPVLRLSPLPAFKIARNLRENNMLAQQSCFAGFYVCNSLFYETLSYVKKNHLDIKAGFIHLPLPAPVNPNSMSNETLSRAVEIAIKTTINNM